MLTCENSKMVFYARNKYPTNLVEFQTIFPELTWSMYCPGNKGARLSSSYLQVRYKRRFYIAHQTDTGFLAF